MARGFVQSLNLFESQDAQSARSIMDNLAGEGINVDIRLFANNLRTTTEVSLNEYIIENAADVQFQGNTTVVTSGGAIEDYYRFVVGPNRRDLLPFSTGTIVYVFDNNNAKRYHCVKNSDTLTVFELYNYTVAGGIVGSRNSWNDFIDLNNKTLYRDDAVLLSNMTNFSKDRPILNDGSNPLATFVPIDDDLTDLTPANLEPVSFTNNFLKAASYSTYTDDINQGIDQFYFKESASLLNYRHNSFTQRITVGGFLKINNDAGIEYDVNDNTIPGLYILANGQAKRAFSDTTNPWNQQTNRKQSPFTNNQLDMIYVDPNVVGNTDTQVISLIMEGPSPHFVFNNNVSGTSATTLVQQTPAQGGFTHKMEVEINGETMYLLLVANNVPLP